MPFVPFSSLLATFPYPPKLKSIVFYLLRPISCLIIWVSPAGKVLFSNYMQNPIFQDHDMKHIIFFLYHLLVQSWWCPLHYRHFAMLHKKQVLQDHYLKNTDSAAQDKNLSRKSKILTNVKNKYVLSWIWPECMSE